ARRGVCCPPCKSASSSPSPWTSLRGPTPRRSRGEARGDMERRPAQPAAAVTGGSRFQAAARTLWRERRRVARLVETELAAARQPERRRQAEALVRDRARELDALPLQLGDRRVDV